MSWESAPQTRREVLAGLTCAALAPLEARNKVYNPQLALQTRIWVQEAQFHNRTLPEATAESFRHIYRTGYRRLELAPEFLEPEVRPTTLRVLRQYKLEPTVVYLSAPFDERPAAERSRTRVLETARVMKDFGTRWVSIRPAPKPRDEPKTDAELETQAYQLNRLGDELSRLPLGLLLHHEVAEMRADAREWRYTMGHTEANLVWLSLDVGWIRRAGLEPLVVLDQAYGRLGSLHLRNSREGVWLEQLASGEIDLSKIAQFLRGMSYDGLLVVDLLYEQGTRRTQPLPLSLSLSRLYMQDVFGSRPGMRPVDMGPHVMTRNL